MVKPNGVNHVTLCQDVHPGLAGVSYLTGVEGLVPHQD